MMSTSPNKPPLYSPMLLDIPRWLQSIIAHHDSIVLSQQGRCKELSQRSGLWGNIDFYSPEYWDHFQLPTKEARIESKVFAVEALESPCAQIDKKWAGAMKNEMGTGGKELTSCLAVLEQMSTTADQFAMTPTSPSLCSAFLRDLQETSRLLAKYINLTLIAYECLDLQLKDHRERQYLKQRDLISRYFLVPEKLRKRSEDAETLFIAEQIVNDREGMIYIDMLLGEIARISLILDICDYLLKKLAIYRFQVGQNLAQLQRDEEWQASEEQVEEGEEESVYDSERDDPMNRIETWREVEETANEELSGGEGNE